MSRYLRTVRSILLRTCVNAFTQFARKIVSRFAFPCKICLQSLQYNILWSVLASTTKGDVRTATNGFSDDIAYLSGLFRLLTEMIGKRTMLASITLYFYD